MRRRRPADQLSFDINFLKVELALVTTNPLTASASLQRLSEIDRDLERLRAQAEELKALR